MTFERKEKGTMMRKRNILAAAWVLVMCALCCACGEQGGTLIIGSDWESGSAAGGTSVEQESGSVAESGNPGQAEPGAEGAGNLIRIYVCGAVKMPGVVEIPAGSRAVDALEAAGGFGEGAATAAVNLADWVTDGQMLYFPTEGEDVEQKAQEAQAALGLVNINTADIAALCTLPGIGESRAADIIAYREANGAFASCEDIMKVPGIKNAAYAKIRDKIIIK